MNPLMFHEQPPVPPTRAEAVVRVANITAWVLGWAMLVWGR